MIELRGVRKRYPIKGSEGLEALHIEALTVSRGDRKVLYGRTGSGKTTLLNLIAGLLQPDSGEIQVADICINRLKERDRTRLRNEKIGFLFQFFHLLPALTALENVLLPLTISRSGVGRGATERARELIGAVGLGKRAHHYPWQLSGGEQQRVALARALVHRPAILLADEPTGNLDQETGQEILSLVAEQSAREGITVVMASHNPSAIARFDSIDMARVNLALA